jgi:hypothetical protein
VGSNPFGPPTSLGIGASMGVAGTLDGPFRAAATGVNAKGKGVGFSLVMAHPSHRRGIRSTDEST